MPALVVAKRGDATTTTAVANDAFADQIVEGICMKRILFAVALALAASPALAADLPSPGPAPAAPATYSPYVEPVLQLDRLLSRHQWRLRVRHQQLV